MTKDDKRLTIDQIRDENERDFRSEASRRVVEQLVLSPGTMPWLYVFELTQNAIDAGARNVRIGTSSHRMVFEHDGTEPLDERHVRAVCGVARSTKGLAAVGFMGIGFKSVFQRYRSASVCSSGWRFRFDISETVGALGSRHARVFDSVLPRWDDDLQEPIAPWTTRFELSAPIDANSSASVDVQHLANHQDLAPLAVLASRGLEHLTIDEATWPVRFDDQNHRASVSDGQTSRSWMAFRRRYKPNQDALRRFLEVRRQMDAKGRPIVFRFLCTALAASRRGAAFT
jgi:hypothetical protein